MKNLVRAFALAGILAGFSAASSFAGTVASTGPQPGIDTAAHNPGIYAVAQELSTGNTKPVADIMVASKASIQLVTVTATACTCRVVLSDADGQILRTRAVEGEVDLDFYSMPTGTYHLAVLDASGVLQMQQTLVKR